MEEKIYFSSFRKSKNPFFSKHFGKNRDFYRCFCKYLNVSEMKKIILLLFLLGGFSVEAQNFNRQKLDSLLNYFEVNHQFMGNVAIAQNGKIVYTHAQGYRDVELRTAADRSTVYRIGSISKTITSTIILQLIEEQKLNMETRLSQFYPEIPNASTLSIYDLLSHQSDLYNFTDAPDYLTWANEPKTKEELLEIFKENGSVPNPKGRFNYSNTNYVLLTWIAEDVENKTFEKILEKRIFKKLELKRSFYGRNIKSKNNEAFSYQVIGNWELSPETDWTIALGAGSLLMSASDLTRFFDALFSGDLISKESLKAMTSTTDQVGLGIFNFPYRDKDLYGHTGGIDGFRTMAVYFLNENTGFTLLSNGTKRDLNEVFLGIIDIYFGYDYDLPKVEKVKNPEKFIGIYSAPDFPLAIEIFTDQGFLYGKATGQSSFLLEQADENSFFFPSGNLKIDFQPEKDMLLLHQHENTFELKRK